MSSRVTRSQQKCTSKNIASLPVARRLKLGDSQGQVSHLNAKSFLPTQKVAATNLPADRGDGGKLIKVILEARALKLKCNS